MKHTFTLFATASLLFAATTSWSQHPTCDGSRYVDSIFGDIDTTLAVKFGENTTIGGTFQELFMDVYYPVNDPAAERPAVVLAFGGSFVGGDRSQLSDLCTYYAQRGFVCSCIDYRLYDVFALPDSVVMAEEVVMAVGDFKAAIRYLRKDAATTNQFGIDPDYIFIGGVSAGAIAADHTAYLDSTDAGIQPFVLTAINDNGGWEGNSNADTMYSSAVQGVLNYSGALARANWVSAGEAPLFNVHDDDDQIVPYAGGYATFDLGFFSVEVIYMEGSSLLHSAAQANGVYSQLITIPNSTGHVSYFGDPAWEDSVLVSSSHFLQDILCDPLLGTPTTAAQWANEYQVHTFPNPSAQDVMVHLHGTQPMNYDVQLMDATGRVVLKAMNQTVDSFLLPRADYPAGLYLLQVQPQGAGATITRKIIFQ